MYTFTQEQITVALKANGFVIGWANDWVPPGWNADKGGLTLIEAFEYLLRHVNII